VTVFKVTAFFSLDEVEFMNSLIGLAAWSLAFEFIYPINLQLTSSKSEKSC